MKKAFVILVLCLLGVAFSDLHAQPAGGGAGAAVPTTQQIQQQIDSKQYADVLRTTQRVLAPEGAAAKDVDRHEVLLLRAEAYLQQKQQGPAVTAYQQAVKETSDPTKAGLPKAMIALIQKSKAMMYTPKPSKDPTHPSAPLNIVDLKERKVALGALFDDEWKPTQAKIDALKKRGNTSLTPILEAASLAGEMRGLEIAATGTDKETSTALTDLTDSAAKLMTDYLERQSKRVDEISYQANQRASSNVADQNSPRMGLTANQNTELKDTIGTCEKLALAAELVGNSAGAKAGDFKSISTRSADLGKKANDVLQADYSEIVDPNANRPIQRGGVQGNGVQGGGYKR